MYAPPLQYTLPSLNIVVSNNEISSGTHRNEQHEAYHVNKNSGDEIIHYTHIANKMLHYYFESEYIHIVDEYEEDMDGGIIELGIALEHFTQDT